MIPRATYRVQLNADFDFDAAAAIVPYLARLGISHLYCSPILQAAPGSTHGYDVVDHSRLSDDLGGPSAFARLSRAAADHDLSLVVDIVPNHMALAGASNQWWWDVLEDGPSSRFARAFDIDWYATPGTLDPSVLMPVLGDHYGRVLEAGGFSLARQGGAFVVRYEEHEFPLSPRSITDVVRGAAAHASEHSSELLDLADRLEALPPAAATDATSIALRHDGKTALRHELRMLAAAEPNVAGALDHELALIAADPDALDALLARQNYRLAYWRVASDELDYRRFFDITSLVGLRVEDPVVFEETHALIGKMVASGDIDGLRVDHVDGLRDPQSYLDRLRAMAPDTWLVVEKILAADEELRDSWPVDGTTGYDFARRVGDLFVDPDGFAQLTAQFVAWTDVDASFRVTAHDAELDVMHHELAAEVDRVTGLLVALCQERRRHRDHTRRDVFTAACEVAAAMPVYRTYVAAGQATSDGDRALIAEAVAGAGERRPDIDRELLQLMERALCLDEPGADVEEFAARFQQLTAPVTAKGIEDTALYRWMPLLAVNDVGADPAAAGHGVAPFHDDNEIIARLWPATMLNLSTHDSKRSADVRARLCVLSEIAPVWNANVERWRAVTARHRGDWDDPAMEWLLYQSLVGAWPIDAERLEATMTKSAREAKRRTSWRDQDSEYERALQQFIHAVIDDPEFVLGIERFLAEHNVVARGRLLSLAQCALEFTCPGVPDTYQGDELWNHSLVDPDNRRAVDFEQREALLAEVEKATPEEVLDRADEGAPKLWLLHRLLRHRASAPDRYRSRSYRRLPVDGAGANAIVAFERETLVTVVPCRSTLASTALRSTTISLPRGRWVDVLTGEERVDGAISIATVFDRFPVAVLERNGQ